MRITILTTGTRGDVQPFVALSLGLQAAGHQVRIATYHYYETFVRDWGFDFFRLTNVLDVLSKEDFDRIVLRPCYTTIDSLKGIVELLHPVLERQLDDSWQACQGADAVVYTVTAMGGNHIAERLNIPAYLAILQPLGRTQQFPNYLFPPQIRLGKAYNWLSHFAIEQIFWRPFQAKINRWRQSKLQLPPVDGLDFYGQLTYRRQQPFLYGYSPTVVPKPSDWSESMDVTGYWFLDPPSDWQPPADLEAFIDAGSPPVYIGFGSMLLLAPKFLFEIVTAAIVQSGQRAVLFVGQRYDLDLHPFPDNIFPVRSVYHQWLFPKMAAIVHHGGAGTTAAALWSGVPSLVVPIVGDAFFWGRRTYELGVGPRPINVTDLTSHRLAIALETLTTDKQMQQRAAAVGRQLQQEDGVGRAVAAFHRRLH